MDSDSDDQILGVHPDGGDHSVVLYSGWLQKQGRMNPGWKKRYFQLLTGGVLEYRRKDGGGEAAGYIALRGATLNITYNTDPNGIMELSSPTQSRIFYLRGEKDEFERWKKHLDAVIKKLPALSGSIKRDPSIISEPSSDQAPKKVFKCGWLEKRGRINRAFKRRWFILKSATLEYYKTHQALDAGIDPQGIILVAEGLSSIIPGEAPYSKVLQINSVEGRVYTLASHSETVLEEWLIAIQERHSDSRVTSFTSLSHAEAPSIEATQYPPASTVTSIKGTMSMKKSLIRPLLKAASHKHVCKLGCGGASCKKCDPCRGRVTPIISAIAGLNASWVTHNVIASTRPSDRLIEKFDILSQFRKHGITAIFNLQQPGEHADCGDGNIDGKWSYSPQKLYDAGISVFLFSFADYGVPTVQSALLMTKAISQEIDFGGKCLVHCHAGHGRTGILISCYLVYALGYSAAQAVTLTRQRRDKAIQTMGQVQLVKDFDSLLTSKRTIFSSSKPNGMNHVRTVHQFFADQWEIQTDKDNQMVENRLRLIYEVRMQLVLLLDQSDPKNQQELHPGEKSMETLARLKEFVDVGVWEPLRKCTDLFALTELMVDFLRHFTHQSFSPWIIAKLIELGTSSKSSLKMPLVDADTPVETSLVHSILSVLQIVQKILAKTDSGSFDRFSVKVAFAVSCIPMSDADHAKSMPLAKALSSLAKLDLEFWSTRDSKNSASDRISLISIPAIIQNNDSCDDTIVPDSELSRPVSMVEIQPDLRDQTDEDNAPDASAMDSDESDEESSIGNFSDISMLPPLPEPNKRFSRLSWADDVAAAVAADLRASQAPPITNRSPQNPIYEVAASGPALNSPQVIYTVAETHATTDKIIGHVPESEKVIYTTMALSDPKASQAKDVSGDAGPVAGPSDPDADATNEPESINSIENVISASDFQSQVDTKHNTPTNENDTLLDDDSTGNEQPSEETVAALAPATVGVGSRERILTGLGSGDIARIRSIRNSIKSQQNS